MTNVLIKKKKKKEKTQTYREKGHMKLETEIGVLYLQAKEC